MNKDCCRIPIAFRVCVALCVLAGGVSAAEFYVTPGGAGDYGGTNWHNAYSNVQTAASLATNAGGDRIYLRWGVYSNAAQVVISNAAGLTVYGGRIGGSGAGSNDYSGTNSTLTRTGGVMRILFGQSSTLTVANVTVSGGYFSSETNNGAGLLFQACAATLTNCVVCDNTNICTTGPAYGGGLCAVGGSLTILDSVFRNNRLTSSGSYGRFGYGGAIAAVNCPLIARGSGMVFSNNTILASDNYVFGGAVYATNGALALEDATLIGNWVETSWTRIADGGAVFHEGSGMSATFTGCRFATNEARGGGAGGALYLCGATGVITACTFTNNYAYGNHGGNGGGIYATRLQSLQVVSSVFKKNRFNVTDGLQGGTFYLTACSNTVVDGCTIDGSGLAAGTSPELVYVTGAGSTWFVNSALQNNAAGRGLSFVGGAGSVLTMTNCLIADNKENGLSFIGGAGSTLGLNHCAIVGNSGTGLSFSTGSAGLLNCLLARNTEDGMSVVAGTVTVANCTLADNGGWGFSRSGGAGVLINSIALGNCDGGIVSNENVWVDYSCLPAPAYGGASNIVSDPLFAPVAGCYYLSVSGLTGQVASSPCLDRGSNTASFWGLTNRTTCTSGTNDSGIVDMGYHYTNGSSLIRTISNCYVDAVNGANTNSGASWAAAWQSLAYALSNVAANARINVATGTYNAANGEVFPLTVQMANLTLAASNDNPALTVVDNAGTNGQQVLQAQGKGTVVLQGLTFRGGYFDSGQNNGAGLLFQACAATLTNCVVCDNTNICTTGPAYGGGLCAVGGSLTILDSVFRNNRLTSSGSYGRFGYGGGIAAVNCPLIARGSGMVFSNNTILASDNYVYGGAIYATNATLTLEDATLIGNWLETTWTRVAGGGAVYHEGSGMSATFTGCRFATNEARGGGAGGALYLCGATGVITACTFTNNYASGNHGGNGGGIYATRLQSLQVVSSVFKKNRFNVTDGLQGGTFYLTACSNTVVDGCTIDGSGLAAGTSPELVYVTGGGRTLFLNSTLQNNTVGLGMRWAGSTLALTNCLLARNAGDGMLISSGAAAVVNCTLADNIGWGIARPTSAGLTVKNSIFWGNTLGGIGHNQNLTLTFTDAQDAWAAGLGAGNFSADPLFVDAASGDYHEMGVEGSYHNGAWEPDGRNSPCLDAGDPASDWSQEPKPCGNRINAGAYGNTAEATRSLPRSGTVLRVW